MARRLKQVIDLYATGQVLELSDGSPVWVQPLNPFEQDTARNEAQIARSRIAMAVRQEGHDEVAKVRIWFDQDGRPAAEERLVASAVAKNTTKIVESIRNDSDWTERMAIIDRGTDETATPLEEVEQTLLARLLNEFAAELGTRLAQEREFEEMRMEGLDDEALWEAYLQWYVDERAGDVMLAEFRLHQILFGVRCCDGVKQDNGTWDHAACIGHKDHLFDTKEEARSAPGPLLELLYIAVDQADMTMREAKNSDRQGSSSGSSPLPNEAEESTASTPTETPNAHLGSSSAPSPTDSLSSAGGN